MCAVIKGSKPRPRSGKNAPVSVFSGRDFLPGRRTQYEVQARRCRWPKSSPTFGPKIPLLKSKEKIDQNIASFGAVSKDTAL